MALVTFIPEKSRQAGYPQSDMRSIVQLAWKPIVLAMFACWVFVVGAHHEAWPDEGQAWLLARDSSLSDLLLRNVRYEGSPGLWHVLLWFCARMGLSFEHLYLISASCAVVGAALILWRAPFPAILRIALIASYFLAYQYAVVARSYALDLILVPALAALFARRAERPCLYGVLIGLLANCNAHSFVAAAVLGCEFALTLFHIGNWRVRWTWAGFGAAAMLGLFALATAWQPADNNFLPEADGPQHLATAIVFISDAFIDRFSLWDMQRPLPLERLLGLILSLVILIPSFFQFSRARMMSLTTALFAGLVLFSTLKYGRAWHSGVLFLFWIFALWITWRAAQSQPILQRLVAGSIALVLSVQAFEAACTGLWDIDHPYSGAPQAAKAIMQWRAEHPDGRIAALGFKAFGVQPFFGANIFANYHAGALKPAYVVWAQGEAWNPAPTLRDCVDVSLTQSDLLVVSLDALPTADRTECRALLEQHSYQEIANLPGDLLWKGSLREDNSLLLFSKTGVLANARPYR